jgi:hypothetical protein
MTWFKHNEGRGQMSCIFVAGMHRSGTSCLAGTIQAMGIEFGEVFLENKHNKKGNRENSRITRTNDILLRLKGGAWDNPVLVTEWNDAARAERDSIINEIKNVSVAEHWGFKDPRALFTTDFWLEAEPEMLFIGTYRHPYKTALSLNKRGGISIENGLQLWKSYNVRLLELLGEHQFDLVNFDLSPQNYLADTIEKLIRLGADTKNVTVAREFFDANLRNQTDKSIESYKLPAEIKAVYDDLCSYYRQANSA